MPQLKRLPADADADAIAELLDTDGALILEDVAPPAQVAAAMGEIGPYIEATAPGGDDFTGLSTTRTGALVARSAAMPRHGHASHDPGGLRRLSPARLRPLSAAPHPGDPHPARPAEAGAASRPPGLGRIPQGRGAAAQHHLGHDRLSPRTTAPPAWFPAARPGPKAAAPSRTRSPAHRCRQARCWSIRAR